MGVLVLALFSSCLLIWLVVWQAWSERAELLAREKDALSRMAQVVCSELDEKLEKMRLYFELAYRWTERRPRADPRFDPEFASMSEAYLRAEGMRIDIRLVSSSGGLHYLPSDSPEPLADLSDRDYVRAQADPATRGFYIGVPVVGKVTGRWTIPISYPLAPGAAGISVIFAAIELPDFEAAYERVRPKPNGSIALTRGDGILLARVPFEESSIGRSLPGPDVGAWRAMIAASPTGLWEVASSIDGKERLIAYAAAGDPDIVVSVSVLKSDLLERWRSSLPARAALAALMLAAIAAGGIRLARALSELGAAQTELADKNERLERSDATKDKIFSVIAHDLRGPLGGMRSLLDSMAEDPASLDADTLAEFLSSLRLAAWNTTQLLENLLGWARSQRGELRCEPVRTAFGPLAEECLGLNALAAAGKRLALSLEAEEGLELRADPELLKVVLRNLLSNAVKFSRPGGRVTLAALREAGGVRITVSDEGVGMGRAELEGLFVGAAAQSRVGTHNEKGAGLGLALCREILERHGGGIEARSEEGRGSAFSAFLPDQPS